MNEFPDNIAELFSRYADGTIGTEEREQLHAWASSSQENRAMLELLSGQSEMGPDLRRMMEYDRDRVWKAIRTARKRKRTVMLRRMILAGSAAAILAIGWLGMQWVENERERQDQEFMAAIAPGKKEAVLRLSDGRVVPVAGSRGQKVKEADDTQIAIGTEAVEIRSAEKSSRKEQPSLTTLEVPSGGEFSLVLADGTKVWLNSESSITFPTRFGDKERKISLSGEAYFEVVHNPSRPFIVEAPDMTVTVFGTTFNLTAYNDESRAEATLIEGVVRVKTAGAEHTLVPGQQAALNRSTGQTSVKKVYADTYACWTKGMFVFFDEPLESLCRKLSRWYDVEIDATNEAVRDIRFSGVIRKYEMFNDIQQLLSATNEVRFTRQQKRIVVLPAQSRS